MKRFLDWFGHNRFTVVMPVLALGLWIYAGGCVAVTSNPTNELQQVNARELSSSYQAWLKECEIMQLRFEAAGEDIENQLNSRSQFLAVITSLASGSVADWGGLVQLIIGSGLLGFAGDNVRKGVVIDMLKKKA